MKKFFGNLFSQPNIEDVEIEKKAKAIDSLKKETTSNQIVISSNQERYSTFLSTDKPIYKYFFKFLKIHRKGDTVYCRAVVLNSFTNQPASSTLLEYLRSGVTAKVLGPVIPQINLIFPRVEMKSFL
jgi:hypothetical protein